MAKHTLKIFGHFTTCMKGLSCIDATIHLGRIKCIQYFIQHQKFSMLDEMLDAFEGFQNLEKNKKEEKNHVG